MEMLIGTAYNNKGESFKNTVNKAYAKNPDAPKNFKSLMYLIGKLEGQTTKHIPRLRSRLNKQRKYRETVSGKPQPKSMKEKILAPFS